MLYWDTPEASGHASDVIREFAGIWQTLPKVVFSNTLPAVERNATLATGSVDAELANWPDGIIAVGGAS
jgi:hypothetical protein